MATSKPMLDDLELQQVQKIEIDEDQALAQHSVPALEGDFLQRLGQRATQIVLTGVLTGSEAGTGLKTLQEKFRAAEPVSFVADIATATKVDQVLIEELGMRELAGWPQRFEYALTLRAYAPPPQPQETSTQAVDDQASQQAAEDNAQQVNNIANDEGTLEVQVKIGPGEDYKGIVVYVEGKTTDGQDISIWSDQQTNGTYRFVNIQAGTYTVRAELQ